MNTKYDMQIKAKEIGIEGQKKLRNAGITIIGAGALGTRCAELLCRAGIGKIQIIDNDIIEESNLQRQTLFTEKDINKPKATIAQEKLKEINKECNMYAETTRITEENIKNTISKIARNDTENITPDIIIDCTDNQKTRLILNKHCVKNKVPLISGAIAGSIGTIIVYQPQPKEQSEKTKRPCLNCIFQTKTENTSPKKTCNGLTCNEEGILNTTASIIASIQANEAIKIIIGAKPEKNLIRINLWNNTFEKIKIKKNNKCVVCGSKESEEIIPQKTTMQKKTNVKTNKEAHNSELGDDKSIDKETADNKSSSKEISTDFELKLCKTKAAYSVKTKKNKKLDLKKILKSEQYKIITETPILLIIEDEINKSGKIIAYEYGELLFKTLKDTKKIKEIAVKIYKTAM